MPVAMDRLSERYIRRRPFLERNGFHVGAHSLRDGSAGESLATPDLGKPMEGVPVSKCLLVAGQTR